MLCTDGPSSNVPKMSPWCAFEGFDSQSHLSFVTEGQISVRPWCPPWSWVFKQGIPWFPPGCNKHTDQASFPHPSSVCPSPCSAPPHPLIIGMPKWEQSRFNWDWFFHVRHAAHNLAVLPEWENWRSQGILQPWCYLSCGNLFCFWRSRLGVWGISSLKQLTLLGNLESLSMWCVKTPELNENRLKRQTPSLFLQRKCFILGIRLGKLGA